MSIHAKVEVEHFLKWWFPDMPPKRTLLYFQLSFVLMFPHHLNGCTTDSLFTDNTHQQQIATFSTEWESSLRTHLPKMTKMTPYPQGKVCTRVHVRSSLQTCNVLFGEVWACAQKCVFWSGPEIKLLSAWTVGRGKLRKWLKNKWKNDFPFWALSQWREKAMGRLHAYLSGWGQSML